MPQKLISDNAHCENNHGNRIQVDLPILGDIIVAVWYAKSACDQTVIVVDRNFSLHIGGAARRKTSEVEPLSQSQVFWLLYYIGDRGQVFCLPRGLPARRLRGWHAFYYLIYTKRLDMGRSRKWGVPDQHVHRGGVSFSLVNSSSFLKISQQLQAEHYINPT